MNVKIHQLITYNDKRGVVFEPIEDETINTQQNSHVVISKPGIVRGNHYHLYGTETLAVMGPAFLKFKKADEVLDFEVPLGQVYKFVIPPKVTHAIKNVGEKDNIIICFNTVPHNPENPDVISDILMDS